MPIEQIESGEGFCMALTQDGIVLCWGDGEEGKLGLGDLRPQARPTVLEFLLSEEHRAQLMSSKQRDRLLPAGSRIARPLESKFMVMSISCGYLFFFAHPPISPICLTPLVPYPTFYSCFTPERDTLSHSHQRGRCSRGAPALADSSAMAALQASLIPHVDHMSLTHRLECTR